MIASVFDPLAPDRAKVNYIPSLLLPTLSNLYPRRAARLRLLATQHPLADYLKFCANLVDAQYQLLLNKPLINIKTSNMGLNSERSAPLSYAHWPRHPYWQQLLEALLIAIYPIAPASVQQVIEQLSALSDERIEQLATALLARNFTQVGSDRALFLWAALSLYWAQLAQQLPNASQLPIEHNAALCPLCHSLPVASTIHLGTHHGLRYLHCSLCESNWHTVRAQCSNCLQSQHLDYWLLDNMQAPIRAESCKHCHSYLKILYQEKAPEAELIADDLSTLFLDEKVETQGFAKSGLNPLLFPAN